MNVGKRAFLYLTRKKGKNLLLGIVFLLISFSLLTGSAVYLGIRQVSEDLRSNIGASFNIRPYEQFDVNNGQVSSKGTPVMDEQSIRRVISIVGKELKCYNTEHSGYVKGENLSFLAGTGHSEESNMGTVKAVRDSSLSFFIADPLHLDKMVSEIKGIDSIAWNNHIINANDFKYSKIAEQFQSMQKVVVALIAVAAVLGFLVLMLILTFRIRGRMQEAGILRAVGKSKQQIIGQFLIEAMILLWIGFLLAIIIFLPLADTLNSLLFDFITQSTIHKNYLQPDFLHFVILLILENLGVLLTVLVCSGVILSLKPKEILTKMS